MPDVRQQINLYQPFSKSRGAFSATQVAAGLLFLIAALAAFTWNEHREVQNLEAHAASLRAAQSERQAALVRASEAVG
jgi:lactam utilization protein B